MRLKAACGTGGVLKEDSLEIQGRHLERVRGLLVAMDYKRKG